MTLVEYNHLEDYQILDNTVLFWDWPNQRVKILTYQNLSNNTLKRIKSLAIETGMGKIIACAPPSCQEMFLGQGFEVEGKIKGFLAGEDALCYSFFVSKARKHSVNSYNGIFPFGAIWDRATAADKQPQLAYVTRNATEADISGMIGLFNGVFETYPSPVFDAEYLRTNMKSNRVLYKVAAYNDKIIGIASAEKDQANLNAEITDCVTNPQYRGHGILNKLISELEAQLETAGFICLYTLCRATQAAVNKAFFRQGYSFSGRLIKNCNICGSFEDMNILVKLLE